MGDGHANGTTITMTEEETKNFLESLVATLNESRPAWAAELYVDYTDGTSPLSTKPCWRCRISLTVVGGDPACWNPVRSALDGLGILDNGKANEFPNSYKTATEDVRAAALAVFIDSDGTVKGNGYFISQSVGHSKAIADAREMGLSLGIRAGEVYSLTRYKPDSTPTPMLSVCFSGEAFVKLQSSMLIGYKRLGQQQGQRLPGPLQDSQ